MSNTTAAAHTVRTELAGSGWTKWSEYVVEQGGVELFRDARAYRVVAWLEERGLAVPVKAEGATLELRAVARSEQSAMEFEYTTQYRFGAR